MRESLRMVLVLTVIAMVSAGVLSQVYQFTSPIIAENQAERMESGVFEVLENVDSVEFIDGPFVMFRAYDADGNPVGFAYAGEGSGYAGPVRVLVGVDHETKEVTGITVLEHTETPGLGTQIEEEDFRSQFVGKDTDDDIEIDTDIDNITGATQSARAVAQAVRENLSEAISIYEGENH